MNDWMATCLFHILVVAIVFSPTVLSVEFERETEREIEREGKIVGCFVFGVQGPKYYLLSAPGREREREKERKREREGESVFVSRVLKI